jgi:hypothetical protein
MYELRGGAVDKAVNNFFKMWIKKPVKFLVKNFAVSKGIRKCYPPSLTG